MKLNVEKIIETCKDINEIQYSYSTRVLKRKGKVRFLTIPNKTLKTQQQVINNFLQQKFVRPEYLHTGYKKCSVKNVLNIHKKSKMCIVMDIKNYYKSIPANRIKNFYKHSCDFDDKAAEVLYKLTTYKDQIPLGIPTSNLLSFLVCKDVFDELYNYCKDLGYNITIYADDIVISGNILNPPEVISNVQKILQKAGLVLNYKKLRIYGAKKRIMNIHIDKNGKCSIDNKLRKSIVVLQNKKDLSPKEMQTLQGMLNYKKYIEE